MARVRRVDPAAEATLGWIGSILFAVGAVSSLMTGWLIRRVGDLPLAALVVLFALVGLSKAFGRVIQYPHGSHPDAAWTTCGGL